MHLADRLSRPKLQKGLGTLSDGIGEAVELLRSRDPALLLGAAGYMLFDVAMLGACFAAFGFAIPPAGILLVAYLVGQLGNLIPIPGGIGGVDAGLIGTLVLYGVEPMEAVPAVIAYRAFVLWVRRPSGCRASLRCGAGSRPNPTTSPPARPASEVEVLGAGIVQAGDAPVRLAAPTRPGTTDALRRSRLCEAPACTHLDSIEYVDRARRRRMRGVPGERRELDAPADVPGLRPRRLLRQLAGPARDRAPHATGHPVIRSIEPGEEWSWCYVDEVAFELERAR